MSKNVQKRRKMSKKNVENVGKRAKMAIKNGGGLQSDPLPTYLYIKEKKQHHFALLPEIANGIDNKANAYLNKNTKAEDVLC